MAQNTPSCFRCVDGKTTCSICCSSIVKNGKTKGGTQRYKCITCGWSRVAAPVRVSFGRRFDQQITHLLKEGCGIRSTGRILGIAPATVIRKIIAIAEIIDPPSISPAGLSFQVDELHTFVKKKKSEICVIYSWDKVNRKAVSLMVGRRSKINLRAVVSPLVLSGAKNINTDKYSGYKGVVPKKLHTTFKRRNNHIERQNLTLRTHLKRLNRKTICFSKSSAVLAAVIKIYFWG